MNDECLKEQDMNEGRKELINAWGKAEKDHYTEEVYLLFSFYIRNEEKEESKCKKASKRVCWKNVLILPFRFKV